jgi:erythromycin esterase
MTHPTPTNATLDDWIAREAIPFSLDSPGAFSTAVDKVTASLGDSVELLGLGEALHGGEDILILRNRLFQHLVEAHGYSAIAIESSFPRAHLVNEYLAGRGPASYEAVQDAGFSHGFGRLNANRELVEWMRQYNAAGSSVSPSAVDSITSAKRMVTSFLSSGMNTPPSRAPGTLLFKVRVLVPPTVYPIVQ